MRLRALLVTVPLAAVLVGCGSDPGIEPDGSAATTTVVDLSDASFTDLTDTATAEVDALDNTFKAEYVEVNAGTPITFRNDGMNVHNVIPAVEGEFVPVETDDFEPGAETTITFEQPGDYAYYCSLHGTVSKGMTGAVRVVEE